MNYRLFIFSVCIKHLTYYIRKEVRLQNKIRTCIRRDKKNPEDTKKLKSDGKYEIKAPGEIAKGKNKIT